ncbi:MAG: tetratricopeptide repeat protein [Pyrinomonadaceae bacterium]|nr:tetratricopeptide repeat protein [Pyrinomonadaceae bacterium]
MRQLNHLFLLVVLVVANLQAQTPSSAKDYFDTGVALFQKGELDGALTNLTKAIELTPRYPDALLVRGMLLFLRKDMEVALADFNKAIDLVPNAPRMERAYNIRSIIRDLKGDRDGALSDVNKAIQMNPKYAPPYIGRGNIQAETDLDKAIRDYELAIVLDPSLEAAYVGRAMARFQKGNLPGAIADFDKAIEKTPTAYAYVERGVIRGIAGDIDGAMTDMRKGSSLNPETTSDKDRGNATSPFKNVTQFIKSNPTNARAYEVRGLLRLFQGKKAEADLDFAKSLELDPKLKLEIERLVNVEFDPH